MNDRRTILIRYDEIGLKGKNRNQFIDCLVKNIREQMRDVEGLEFKAPHGRIFIYCSLESAEECSRRLQKIPGVASASVGVTRPRDFDALAGSGTKVAHCPVNFVRRGILLESFARYRAAGIAIGIGTDTYPHNMIEELRIAALAGRIQERSPAGAKTAEVFEAGTLGGARLLGREDIGRLAVGAKADLVLVDLENPAMRPLRDPLRSLIFTAAERAVRDVYVGGEQVVRDGRVLTLDRDAALARLVDVRARAEARVPERDWAGRTGEELSPLSLPVMEA